jgi:CBS domain-containing protein
MKVCEVMSKDVLVASPDDTIQRAATLMAQVDCGALAKAAIFFFFTRADAEILN